MAALEPLPTQETGIARWVMLLGPAAQLAERIANTQFVPAAMRGKPDVITAAILYGDEIGVGAMQALSSIHVVDGRPGPSSELCRAMILNAGHNYIVHEMSATRCRVSGLRSGRPETERVYIEWTIDMARAAGLLNRPNWRSYPRSMLLARATGDLARVAFPDVIKGLGYVAEDVDPEALEAWDPATGEVTAPAKPRKAIQRRRRPVAEPVVTEALETPQEAGEPPIAPPEDYRVPIPENHEAHAWEKRDAPLPPELLPEQARLEDPPESMRISPGWLKTLHISLGRELGTVATREEKLSMLSAILGRPVESSKTLTPDEGKTAVKFLSAVANGSAAWDMDPETGEISVRWVR